MKKYIINNLNIGNFNRIITLLDYEIKISQYLKSINLSSFIGEKLLIDTALCSGMGKYRFIAIGLNNDGTINRNNYKYIDVVSQISKIADEIIQQEPLSFNNSVLTIPQMNSLANTIN